MTTLTEQTARAKFAHYFLLLKDSLAAEGGNVSMAAEWERGLEPWIEEGDAPAEAVSWKCPRSLEAEICKQ